MFFFFFNDSATTEIYTLSLHDALPISSPETEFAAGPSLCDSRASTSIHQKPSLDSAQSTKSFFHRDRKSTRLNSSHEWISYAVFCLKKKKKTKNADTLYNK